MAAKHPEIRFRLDAASDDFRIVDHVTKAMRQAGIHPEKIEKFCDEAMSGEIAICYEYADDWSLWCLTDGRATRSAALVERRCS
jgi:hypothetical protein